MAESFKEKNKVRCDNCNKLLLEKENKCYDYKCKSKGSFDINTEKVYCENCYMHLFAFKEKEKPVDEQAKLMIKVQQGKGQNALAILNKNFDKNNSTDWYNKGNILINLGKYKEAISCYDEAILLDTHYVKAWYRKGVLLFESGNFDDAEKCFDNIIKIEKPILEGNRKMKILGFSEKKYSPIGESGLWTFVSFLMKSHCNHHKKNFKIGLKYLSYTYELLKQFPRFKKMSFEEFMFYSNKNSNELIDFLEPKYNLMIYTSGERH